MLDKKLVTWDNLDIPLIQKAYDEISSKIFGLVCDTYTMKEIKSLLEGYLPDYDIKCDEENNPPEVVDSARIFARVSKKKPDGSYGYVDVIF